MASKKTESDASSVCVKKRYLNAVQCKAAAARISAEMRTYHADIVQWYAHGIAPVVPLWGPDYDAVEAKINRFYHPDEAAIILGALTP